MKSLGITPFQKAPNDQQAVAWAQANPTDPRAAQILALNQRQTQPAANPTQMAGR